MAIDSNYFKSSFDRVMGDLDMGQYDLRQRAKGRKRRTGIEHDYEDPYEQVSDEAQKLFPEMQGLSDTEQEELGKYKSRLRDLQNMEAPDNLGSRRQPGNPYSMDTTGLLGGIADLTEGVVNRERQDRIYGDEDKASRASRGAQVVGKLGDWLGVEGMQNVREKSRDRREERYSGFDERTQELKTKKTAAAENQQNRQEYIRENTPERAEKQNEYKREDRVREDKQKQEKDMAGLEHEYNKKFETYKNSVDGGNTPSPSIVSGMARVATDLADMKIGAAEDLRKIKQKDFYNPENHPNIDERISAFEKDANRLMSLAGSVFTENGKINSKSLSELNTIIGDSENNRGGDGKGEPGSSVSNPVSVETEDEWNELPDGTYVEKDGEIWIKGGE